MRPKTPARPSQPPFKAHWHSETTLARKSTVQTQKFAPLALTRTLTRDSQAYLPYLPAVDKDMLSFESSLSCSTTLQLHGRGSPRPEDESPRCFFGDAVPCQLMSPFMHREAILADAELEYSLNLRANRSLTLHHVRMVMSSEGCVDATFLVDLHGRKEPDNGGRKSKVRRKSGVTSRLRGNDVSC